MLAQRVVTAVVLLAVLLGALLAPSPWPLVLVLTVAAACAAWEWLRLTWPRRPSIVPVLAAAALACLMLAAAESFLGGSPALADFIRQYGNGWLAPLVAAAWVLVAGAMVLRGRAQAAPGSLGLSLFGLLAVWTAWAALIQLYLAHGALFLVTVLAFIWCADIGAYFAGKALGRHKLAPSVSPGKTWEGAAAGVAAAVLWVVATRGWAGTFGDVLVRSQDGALGRAALLAALLAALSIVGDLFESLLKRRAGLKDSSQLLPGHGGVYDRLDALLPVAPCVLLLVGAVPA